MAWDKGFNFRATSEFVADGADETYVLAADAYPTTRNGVTFGWEQAVSGSVNRNAATDRRLAGIHYFGNVENPRNFRVDLPETGTYNINAAFGDWWYAGNYAKWSLLDGATTFQTFTTNLIPYANFVDATNVVRSAADWIASHASLERVFASQILRVSQATFAISNVIAHLFISQQPSTTPVAVSGSASATFTVTGTMRGLSHFSGTASAAFSASGTVHARRKLSGTASSVFTVSGRMRTIHHQVGEDPGFVCRSTVAAPTPVRRKAASDSTPVRRIAPSDQPVKRIN